MLLWLTSFCVLFPWQQKRLAETRQLPVASMSVPIVTAVARHQVIVIRGHTGCGKTTQVSGHVVGVSP